MSAYDDFTGGQDAHAHLVQFYQDEPLLAGNVADFLLEGLRQGDAGLVIASSDHNAEFGRKLRESGVDPDVAIRERRLLFADAEQTLRRFMLDGQPDWYRFERTIRALIREVRPEQNHYGLRAYGEMVGLLWRQKRFSAAIRLEHLWNKLMAARSFRLYCAYPIDVFGKDFHAENIDALLCAHTHLLSTGRNGDLYSSVNRAMTEVLGTEGPELLSLVEENQRPSWASMPEAETAILWLRNNLPERADEILTRARQYYRNSVQELSA